MRVGSDTESDGCDTVRLGSEATVPTLGPCCGPLPSGSSSDWLASRSWRRSTTAFSEIQSA